ncbi:MAG TPA: hypothetical protein VG101_07725 [Puia sp.]|jgi:hypothetical protein|nr:hypothetical protein [Puia sp.]
MKYIKKGQLLRALPHFIAILTFAGVAYLYCRPAFENKVLSQEDVLQWQGMARNSFQYKETHGHFPLWTNSMFSGMPAFQIAMDSESVGIPGLVYGLLTFYLRKPASFFFMACACFYFLSLVLRVNPYIGIIGALAYAYATYNPVIVSVGHDTKMQSIALLPGVIGSLILICERRYWLGMMLLAMFTALLVSFNHVQIVYYTMIIAAGLLLGYIIPWIRNGQRRRVIRVVALTMGAGVVGVLCNAVTLFTTYDSSKETIRAGSELATAAPTNPGGSGQDGLSDSAAFEFSMFKSEPLVMFVPDIYGGSTELQLPLQQSKAARVLKSMPPDLASEIGSDGPRYYWGGVGKFFAGPPYVGAIIVQLALMGIFIRDNRHKWWILGVCALTIAMSWGVYFYSFNSFLLKWLPLYNKFRAPSMILVVPTFLICMLATITLDRIFAAEDRALLRRGYRRGVLIAGGLFVFLIVLYFRFSYSSEWESDLLKNAANRGSSAIGYMADFVRALRDDRRSLFGESLLRSMGLVAAAALILGLYLRNRIRPNLLLGAIGLLIFADVFTIDLRYLNDENYMERDDYQQNFEATKADRQIQEDKGYFRVLDLRDSLSNSLTYGAMTAYFHLSIGGYHAAKLKIYEDLINRQLYNFPNCSPVINMLNTKYIIKPAKTGGDSVLENKNTLGPVWFVRGVRFESSANDVMNALTHFNPRDTAIVFSADRSRVKWGASGDSLGTISLVKNDNDEVNYLSQAPGERFAVFSEVYYDRGWRAWIDDHEAPIIRANYVLRGMSIPPGRHVIRFFFRPLSYYLGRQIQWMANIVFLLLIAGATIVAVQEYRRLHPPASGDALLQAA